MTHSNFSLTSVAPVLKTTVLGCGRWASFQAWYVAGLGHQVMMYGRTSSARWQNLHAGQANHYLQLPATVAFTSDLARAIEFADVIHIAIEAQQLRDLAREISVVLHKVNLTAAQKTWLLCMKGLEAQTGYRLTQIMQQELGVIAAVWVGPGHVQDFVAGIPNCMLIDAASEALTKFLVDRLASELIRFYQGRDLIGTEVGAALKNVLGIAAGLLDGAGYAPLKGALMTRGAAEVSRLIAAMGGDARSAYGLCHLGDYQATLFSAHSHNRLYGEAFVKQQPMAQLAEGVATLQTVALLQEKYAIELPICQAISAILADPTHAQQQLRALLSRPLTTEF